MDMIILKAKAKGKKDQTVGFVRRHWKDILLWGGIAIAIVLSISKDHSDEEIEIVGDNDDDNFDSNSYVGIDEDRESQTYVPMDTSKRLIGEIDVTGSRLKDNEKQFLEAYSEQYDRFKGKEQTVETKTDGWSSDGRYTRYTKAKHSFGDDKMSITVDNSYKDDDGQTGGSSSYVESKARNIINYFKENKNLEMFDDVRDIVDIL